MYHRWHKDWKHRRAQLIEGGEVRSKKKKIKKLLLNATFNVFISDTHTHYLFPFIFTPDTARAVIKFYFH